MASSSSLPIFTFFVFLFTITSSISATEFQVGGVVGWRIPATNESQLYTVWASRRRFHVGDTLRFRYKNDSVVEVQKWGLYHCDSSTPIAFFNDGDTVVNLDNVGTMYFISGNAKRCKQGVNMIVDVMSPNPVRYFPPVISSPPEMNPYSNMAPAPSSYSNMAPAPSQFVISSGGDSSTNIPGPSSDSVRCFSVSVFVIAVIVGLGSFVLKPY